MPVKSIVSTGLWKYEDAALRHPYLTAALAAFLIACAFAVAVGWDYSAGYFIFAWAILGCVHRSLRTEERIDRMLHQEEEK